VPIEELLGRLADGRDSALVTSDLQSFLGQAERHEWQEALGKVTRWTALGCEPPRDHPITRLGADVAWVCYARAEGPSNRFAVTALYTPDWRAVDVEGYSY